MIHATFALANRAEIESEIERLIGLLDTADAPFEDLEPEHDFGAEERGEPEEGPATPRYGADQSLGPINVQEAEREHRAQLLGLARSPTGGWRWPS